jgi:phenylpropionate dioxygenase-like ring-hydroxylating dioxygenase large terminal subunit
MNEQPKDVMRSPLPPSVYLSPEILALEQERIFRKLWIFAGPKQLLAEESAYLTRRIGGVPIVIQRLDGKLRAFENLCAHRQMALQWEAVGKRPLVCKYHGWAYDADGCVRGIPNSGLFEIGDETRRSICLKEFSLREVGNLLFVNLDVEPLAIERQFSDEFISGLEDSSLHFDHEVAYAHFERRYNWKLNFENVLDYNHIQFIHPKSFYPALTSGSTAELAEPRLSRKIRAVKLKLDLGVPLDLRDLSYALRSPLNVPEPWYRKEIDRYGNQDDYYNWFAYPNINYCSTHGQMFYIQQFMPKSPTLMEYHLWVMTARRKDPHFDLTALLWELTKAELSVIQEDANALEQMQANLYPGAISARHGTYEAHIVRMHRWYASTLGIDDRCDGTRHSVKSNSSVWQGETW